MARSLLEKGDHSSANALLERLVSCCCILCCIIKNERILKNQPSTTLLLIAYCRGLSVYQVLPGESHPLTMLARKHVCIAETVEHESQSQNQVQKVLLDDVNFAENQHRV